MNIFVLDTDPLKAACYHHDRHVVKMILETAQLLSGVWHTRLLKPDGADPGWHITLKGVAIYKPTHLNHPCAVWARSARRNYVWLQNLGMHLCREYTHRYGKVHKTQVILEALSLIPDLDKTQLMRFTQCMPDIYKKPGDAVGAYRAYYIAEKVEGNKWTNRTPPDWVLAS